MSRVLFGTDGIRGQVGQFPIDPETMVRLGFAIGKVLPVNKRLKVVLGKDTRLSGYMLESALEAGLIAAGVDVILTGPLPTPAVTYLAHTLRADLAVVVSASHNPYSDNGVKLILPDGSKPTGSFTKAIERYLRRSLAMKDGDGLGRAERLQGASARYVELCKSKLMYVQDLRGIHVVLDLANGAGYQVAPSVFRELNARVTMINNQPDGLNINRDCGSTAPQGLVEKVQEVGAHLGVAYDGDGDRVILVDGKGQVLDGDDILWILAHNRWRYPKMTGMVSTVMSNGALADGLRSLGLDHVRTPVGDRHVMQALRERGWEVGAEPSGHVIDRQSMLMGDGLIASLLVIETMLLTEFKVTQLPNRWQRVHGDIAYQNDSTLREKSWQRVVDEMRKKLPERSELVVRPSGTEPKLRYSLQSPRGIGPLAAQLVERLKHAIGQENVGI